MHFGPGPERIRGPKFSNLNPVGLFSILQLNGKFYHIYMFDFPVVAGFSFEHVTVSKIETEIKNLNSNKATTFGNIPPKLLKTNSDICAEPLQKIFNECVSKSQFPDELKAADVSSLFKKDVSTSKTNYRPISVLPTVSKIYERLMYKQMMEHMTAYLSDLLCGFRQGYNAHHALTRFLEKCKIYCFGS